MIDRRPDVRRDIRYYRLNLEGAFRTKVICSVLKRERRMNRRDRWRPAFVRQRHVLRARIQGALLDFTDPEGGGELNSPDVVSHHGEALALEPCPVRARFVS